MKALVTGDAGYIGGVLADQLSRNGHDVVGFDRASDQADDIRNRKRVASLFADHEFDIVYHLAAEADVWEDDWQYLFDNNVTGTVNIIAAAREADVPVVFASSVAASGEFNLYGRSKNIAEQAISEFDGVTTVRFPNVIGGDAPRGQAHDMIQEALDGKIEVWGNGDIERSYVDVGDLCAAIRAIGPTTVAVQLPASIYAHTTTNLDLGELIQTVVAEETEDKPSLSLVDRSPPSPQVLTAADFQVQNPRSLKESVRSQVTHVLVDK